MINEQGAGVVQEEAEETAEEAIERKLREQEPSEEEKDALLDKHRGHLIRHTTSQITESENVTDDGGIQLDIEKEVPDTYCFTCEEWVGLSGVDLRGTPRSKADAYYYGGMPEEIKRAKGGVKKTLNELSDALRERLERVADREDAFEFISDELEEIQHD